VLRGAGSEGLAGMTWRAPSPADSRMVLVRPLLGFAKAELLAFARENQIRFREDATNFSTDILRNRLRHQLLPLLREKYQPALTRTILRTMELLGAEEEWIGEMARDWLQRSGQPAPLAARRTQRRALDPDFDALPAALQRRILHQQLVNTGIAADFELVESLRRAPGVWVSVARNLCAVRDERGLVKLRAAAAPEFNSRELAVALTAPAGRAGETVFDGVRFQWRIRPCKAPLPRWAARRGNQEFFDADQVGERIVLRHWRPGDRFQPIGLKAPAKLQDLFVNAKIPARRRRQLVVAESAGGEIFWVEGLRIGERFKLTPQTRRSLLWRWRSAEGFSSPEKPLQPDRQ
jgi:tRNA(Ile)-lysidine synthase